MALVVQLEGKYSKIIFLLGSMGLILLFFCASSRDDTVPLKITKVQKWIPPSAIKRDALTNNNEDDEETFRKARG